jgi:hypothetical protein
MDAHGFVAADYGAVHARDDPYGLDPNEAGALALYTFECELYKRLNGKLRERDRQQLIGSRYIQVIPPLDYCYYYSYYFCNS